MSKIKGPTASNHSEPIRSKQNLQRIAEKALTFIDSQQIVGLGAGRSVNAVIDAMVSQNIQPNTLVVAADSTKDYCEKAGLGVVLPFEVGNIDCYIDGVDEIDPDFVCLKGHSGAAMTGERLCAEMATSFVVVAESHKVVVRLTKPVCIEVIECAVSKVSRSLTPLCSSINRRSGVLSSDGNPIIDCSGMSCADAFGLDDRIAKMTGVVGHGLFAHCRPTHLITLIDEITVRERSK